LHGPRVWRKINDVAKVRQFAGPVRGWPYISDPAWEALLALIHATRPWSAEGDVALRLRAWASGDAERWETVDVAEQLARIGRLADLNSWSDSAVASLAFDMLHNVLLRRPPWELGALADVTGIPARTRRRHRAEIQAYANRRRRREGGMRELMAAGRKKDAARQWLRRNPGKRPEDAGAPQRRRTELS
jgi:hypothetical protein